MIIKLGQVSMSIHGIVTEICYISNHWNFISNHWTSVYLLLFKKKPCTDRGLTDSQKSEKEKNIGNTIIRRYPSYTDQLMQVGIPDNQKGTTAGDLYDINYDFNYVITCWAQAVIYSNLVIFYNIDYDIDFWPIRHHIRHLSFLLRSIFFEDQVHFLWSVLGYQYLLTSWL